jgi:hypothetical protein
LRSSADAEIGARLWVRIRAGMRNARGALLRRVRMALQWPMWADERKLEVTQG